MSLDENVEVLVSTGERTTRRFHGTVGSYDLARCGVSNGCTTLERVTLEEAIEQGYTPCKAANCVDDDLLEEAGLVLADGGQQVRERARHDACEVCGGPVLQRTQIEPSQRRNHPCGCVVGLDGGGR